MHHPEDGPPRELQARVAVDAAHCERAEQGLRRMAQHRYGELVARQERRGWLVRLRPVARKAALVIAVVAFVGGVVVAGQGVVESRSRWPDLALAAILFLEAWVLWVLARRGDRLAVAFRGAIARWFGNHAARLLRKTRRAVPFEGVYTLSGDQLAYSRLVQGERTLGWQRDLGKYRPRGTVLQVPGLLAFFDRPNLVVPTLIVLAGADGAMAAAIRAAGFTIVDIDAATMPEPGSAGDHP